MENDIEWKNFVNKMNSISRLMRKSYYVNINDSTEEINVRLYEDFEKENKEYNMIKVFFDRITFISIRSFEKLKNILQKEGEKDEQ